ncbi:MAG: class I SAM-dependent RNA methyltransferase [Spirochaetaceae bacterium]|jgi:putative N6-adenine-specific DNA methylase|nr:class I SAM-dependent RNA methyltransferase [Spirochaetaceae bacterium]
MSASTRKEWKTLPARALCAVGVEPTLSRELKKLGFTVREAGFGHVRFQSDPAGLYKALMGLRTADRVLLEAASFPAGDFDALFAGALAAPWEAYIPKGMGIGVSKVRINRSRLTGSTTVQAMVHKAVADRLCRRYAVDRLPEQGKCAELRVSIDKNQAAILLDLCGDPLFKRGYRVEGGTAPLRETTAAALLLLAGWRRKFPLYDPFCGSGTILIEAALFARNIAPGSGRAFALSDLLIGDTDTERAVRADLASQRDFSPSHLVRLGGSDGDPRAVLMAASNGARVRTLPPALLPDIRTLAFTEAAAPYENESGFIITNPPYGRRLGNRETAEAVYRDMAVLTRRFPGWKLCVITDHPGFESFFGRAAESCLEIANGAVQTYFFQFPPE